MSNHTLVYQSFRTQNVPQWIEACLSSVKQWAHAHQFEYCFLGDEIFDLLPNWFRDKVAFRMPILSDLARLLYARKALHTYQRVIWLDADVLIFAPEAFNLPQTSYAFGYERWVQPHKKGVKHGWKVYKNVCNAFCMFERHNPFLDFYIHACEQNIARVNHQFIAPQMIGPKFLSAIHNVFQLPVTQQLGSASPYLLSDLAYDQQSSTSSYHAMRLHLKEACVALNLCHSLLGQYCHHDHLIDEVLLLAAISKLNQYPAGILPVGDS